MRLSRHLVQNVMGRKNTLRWNSAHQPIRFFSWNPFSSSTPATSDLAADNTELRNAKEHERITNKAHREANLHNERLVDACLSILEVCGKEGSRITCGTQSSADEFDASSADTLSRVVDAILHDHHSSLSVQFDRVYAAMCLPVSLQNRQIQRSLMVLLQSVLPQPLGRVFESVNLVVPSTDANAQGRVATLSAFVHALLGDIESIDGLEDEEVLLVYIDDVQCAFPALEHSPAFRDVAKSAASLAMQAKLFALLGKLCAEFDKENTGKVLLADLRETAERVMGKEQANLLLAGAQSEDGYIRYPHLSALLTRPPPSRS